MTKSFGDLLSSCHVDTFKAGGPGGQHQNKTESAVRLVHRPTGITVVCRDERSQHLNKLRCLEILERKLAKLREKPKPRIAATIPQSKNIKRRKAKKHQAEKKALRKRPPVDE